MGMGINVNVNVKTKANSFPEQSFCGDIAKSFSLGRLRWGKSKQ